MPTKLPSEFVRQPLRSPHTAKPDKSYEQARLIERVYSASRNQSMP
jgi:hypothetical protein